MDHDAWRLSGTGALTALVAVLLLVAGVADGTPGIARGDTTENCSAQQQAVTQVLAEIDRHNAQPHVFTLPQQQAEYDAYNAEAAKLNASRDAAKAKLSSCTTVMSKLSAGEDMPKPTQSTIDTINAAKNGLPANYTPPNPPTNSQGGVGVVDQLRPLYDALKKGATWPDSAVFQGKSKPNVGDPDPARDRQPIPAIKGSSSKADVVVEHIVPVAQLLYLPDFLKLPADYMYMVVNAPLNQQWMSAAASMAEASDSVAAIVNADPQWRTQQQQSEKDTKSKLEELITQLVATIPAS